jgi:biotin carboxyl carrier protein
MLAIALLAMTPVLYDLWQLRSAATPQTATAAVSATTAPREDASTVEARPPAPVHPHKPAAAPARARPAADPLKGALAADLTYQMDTDSVKWFSPGDRSLGVAGQPVASAVPFAPPPAPPAASPPEPAPASAAPTGAPRANRRETAEPVVPLLDLQQKFRLTSLAVGRKTPTAIINGRVVTVGDEVEGAKVVAITASTVDLDIAGRHLILRM